MPLYEYRCPSCRQTFELLRPMKDSTAPATCPSGHTKAERVLSLVADRTRSEAGPPVGAGGCCAGGACSCAG